MAADLPVLVRPMQPADRPALLAHAAALNAYEQPFAGDRNLAADGAEASLGQVEASGRRTWVAEADGQVVGHLCLMLDTMPPYVAAERRSIGYVSDAFVQEAARGRCVSFAPCWRRPSASLRNRARPG